MYHFLVMRTLHSTRDNYILHETITLYTRQLHFKINILREFLLQTIDVNFCVITATYSALISVSVFNETGSQMSAIQNIVCDGSVVDSIKIGSVYYGTIGVQN
jgi:hypothetical protein